MTFGGEPDASKRARLVEEHADAIIEHAVTPKGSGEVEEAIARIEAVYDSQPSRTAAEETGRAEYVAALKTAQMRASLRSTLEHAARTTHALARTGRPAPAIEECETGPMRTVTNPASGASEQINLSQRWFEQAARTLAEGRYVTPRSGGATAQTPVHLEVQTYTSVGVEGRVEKSVVTNRLLGPSPTTCGKPGHSASMVRTTSFDPANDINADDCACDAACTHCGAAEGASCTTNDGGGMSGGGYTTKSHSKRIKASARIQGLKDGTRSRCDLGDHQWAVNADGASATCTGACGRTEPVHPSSRRLNRLTPAGSASGQ
jgi:hypothetical protein